MKIKWFPLDLFHLILNKLINIKFSIKKKKKKRRISKKKILKKRDVYKTKAIIFSKIIILLLKNEGLSEHMFLICGLFKENSSNLFLCHNKASAFLKGRGRRVEPVFSMYRIPDIYNSYSCSQSFKFVYKCTDSFRSWAKRLTTTLTRTSGVQISITYMRRKIIKIIKLIIISSIFYFVHPFKIYFTR